MKPSMMVLAMLLIVGSAFDGHAQPVQWQSLDGPWYVASAVDISIGYRGSQRIIYVADSTDNSLLKSTNEGETWIHLPIANPTAVACIPHKPDTLYVGRYDIGGLGMWKSTNGGETFFEINSGFQDIHVTRIAISPHEEDLIYIGCYRYFGSHASLYRSTNAGTNWHIVGPFDENQLTVTSIVFDPQNDLRIWIAGWGPSQNRGVWRTEDAGGSWQRVIEGMEGAEIGGLVGNPASPDTLYAGTIWLGDSRIYRSTDAGDSWETVNNAQYLDIRQMTVDFVDPHYMYAATNRGILKSENGGEDWSFSTNGMYDRVAFTVAVDPLQPEIIWSGNYATIYRSSNRAVEWTEKTRGAFMVRTTDNAVRAASIATVAATVGTGGRTIVNASSDLGQNWRTLLTRYDYSFQDVTGFNGRCIISSSDGQLILAGGGTDRGGVDGWSAVLRSSDAGLTWSETLNLYSTFSTPKIKDLLFDPADASRVFAVSDRRYGIVGEGLRVVYRSTNAGLNWLHVYQAQSGNYANAYAIQIDPQSGTPSQRVFAAGDFGVIRSTDGGSNWSQAGMTNVSCYSLVLNPSMPSTLLAGTASGIYKTTNDGGDWDLLVNSPSTKIAWLSLHPVNTSVIYAVAPDEQKVYRTTDAGANWGEYAPGLPQAPVHRVRLDGEDPNTIYAATDGGIYGVPHIWTGEITVDVTWKSGITYLVEGTLTVASGKTLTIEAGATVEFYSGAALVLGSGAQLIVEGSFTIPSSNTLALQPRATVKFHPPYGELVVNGTLQAIGGEEARIKFISQETGSEWRGISLPAARSGSRIEYADIADAVIGIAVNHNSEASIAHCNITGGKIGIHLYDAPGPWPLLRTNVLNNHISQSRIVAIALDKEVSNVLIQDNTLEGNLNDDVGLQFIYASPLDVVRNRVTNFGKHGIQCISASPSFIDGTEEGGRSCFVNNRIGVYGEASSNFILGIAYDDGTYSGNNTIAHNEEYEIVLRDKCTVYSQMNYHGSRNFDIDDSSRLITEPELGEDPNRCLDQGNRPLAIAAGDQVQETDPPMLSGFTRNPLVKHAVRLRLRRDHLAAIGVLKALIAAQGTNTALAHWALKELLANYQMVSNPSGPNILSGYLRGLLLTQSNAEIRRAIRDVLSGSLRHERQIAATLAALDTCIQSYPNTSSELLALYSKISLAVNVLNDRTLAQATFQTLQAQYPEHSLTHVAGVLVNGGGQLRPTGKSTMAAANTSSSEKPLSYALEQNYPNPFNPTTTIKFRIPERGHVVLRIYDIVGREVNTLLDEHKEAGYYETHFDASQLASGMYLYRIQAGNYVETKKLLLLR